MHVGEGIAFESASGAGKQKGFLIASEDGAEVYHFDEDGQHLRTLDALTGSTRLQFGYDSVGRLSRVTDASGNRTEIERLANGDPLAIDAPLGSRTSLALDESGYLEWIANPAEEALALSYADGGLVTESVDPNGNASSFDYDGNGRLTSIADADGREITLHRSDNGHAVELTTSLGRRTRYEVKRDGERVVRRRTDPDGRFVEVVVGHQRRAATLRTGTKIALAVAADPRWRMQAPVIARATLTTPGGLRTTLAGERSVETAAPDRLLDLVRMRETLVWDGRRFTSQYTGRSRTLRLISSEGRKAMVVLDRRGRVVEERMAGLAPMTYVYGSRGRPSRIVEGQGSAARTTAVDFDDSSGGVTITDPASRRTTYRFDAAGRLTEAELPGGREVRYSYDGAGNTTTVTPPGRSSHLFRYSAGGLPTAYTFPRIGGSPTDIRGLSYDEDGAVDRLSLGGGRTARLTHDGAGRTASVDLTGRRVSASYAPDTGLISEVRASAAPTVGYTYDGALVLSEEWRGSIHGRVRRSYGDRLLLRSLTTDSAKPVDYSYDADGLTRQAGALRLGRDAQTGLVASAALGSVTSEYGYDSYGDLASTSVASRGRDFYSAGYRRDGLGRIISAEERILGERIGLTYRYDTAGRLAEVRRDGRVWRSYLYDENGNRTRATSPGRALTSSYDDRDRLTRSGPTRYRYSISGELASTDSSGGQTRYQYDELGNLLQVRLPSGKRITYDVDGFGRRVGKRVNGRLVRGWLYLDDLRPVAELDGSGRVVSRFVYSSGSNVPDYMVRDGRTYYLVTDQLGSPRLIVDAQTGKVTQRVDYERRRVDPCPAQSGKRLLEDASRNRTSSPPVFRYGAA